MLARHLLRLCKREVAKSKLLNLQSCPPSACSGPRVPRGRAKHSAPNLTKELGLRPHLRRGQELWVPKLLPTLGKGSEHQSERVFHPVLCARRRSVTCREEHLQAQRGEGNSFSAYNRWKGNLFSAHSGFPL